MKRNLVRMGIALIVAATFAAVPATASDVFTGTIGSTCAIDACEEVEVQGGVVLNHLHFMGKDFYLQCIEKPSLDCTGSTHAYHSCILPGCDYTERRGPTFHNRVEHNWSVGYEGQTCRTCGRVEMF